MTDEENALRASSDQDAPPPAPQSSPPPETGTTLSSHGFDPASWPFFIGFSLISLLFWLAEFSYQYFILTPRILETALVRGSAFAGATLISLSLFSSSIFKWYPQYAQYWRIRRYLGVAGVLFISTHVWSVIALQAGWNLQELFYSLNPIENPLIYGLIAYPILLAMLLTSTDWAVRKLKRHWKLLHRFVYVAFAASILHFMFTNPAALANPAGYLLITATSLAAFGQLYWFFKIVSKKRFRSLGTAVGLLIIIAFALFAYLSYARRSALEATFDSTAELETPVR